MCRNVYRVFVFISPRNITLFTHFMNYIYRQLSSFTALIQKDTFLLISLKVLSEHTKVYSTDQVPRLSPKVPGRLKSYLPRSLGPRGLTGSRKDFIHQRLELTFITFSRISFQERREMVASFPLCKKNHLTCCLWTVQLLAQTNRPESGCTALRVQNRAKESQHMYYLL